MEPGWLNPESNGHESGTLGWHGYLAVFPAVSTTVLSEVQT